MYLVGDRRQSACSFRIVFFLMIECLPLFSRKLYNFSTTALGLFFPLRFVHRTNWDSVFFNKQDIFCLSAYTYNFIKAFVVRNLEERP